MTRHPRPTLPLLLLGLAWIPRAALPLSAQGPDPGDTEPVVRAVLFHAPTCPHCRHVIEEALPPLVDRYGSALRITTVDASRPEGNALYRAAVVGLAIPRERTGVPTLLVGTELLVGSLEIPTALPGLVEEGLARGGVDWPPVPALRRALDDPSVAVDFGTLTAAEVGPLALASGRFMTDPAANAAAVAVLAVMLGALAMVWRATFGPGTLPRAPSWLLPLLAVAGAGVAAYLSFVEVTGAEAVCGPVGDCNAVQQSPWARLFGVVPVGLLGLVGYGGILALWGAARAGPDRLRPWAWRVLWAGALFGTGLSVYLTFLEPFVIGASCLWCLTSALIITGVLVAATPRALEGPSPARTG